MLRNLQMFFARGILFVEGISEAILIPEMAKALDMTVGEICGRVSQRG